MYRYYLLLLLGISLKCSIAVVEKDLQGLNIGGFGELPVNITSKLPTQEDAEKILADKCRKNGGEEAYHLAQKAKNESVACVTGLIDFDELQKEMEIAKPSGNLDSVFKKYCKKSPELLGCVEKFTTDFEPCLEEDERKSKNIVLNITTQLIDFICHKEGARIALFIAEGGPECINASEKGIKDCVHTIFKKHLPETEGEDVSLDSLPVLLFQFEQCDDFAKLQKCVVHELEKCKEPTPGNIVDSLFTYVRKVTPCSKFPEQQTMQSNSGVGLINLNSLLVISLLKFILLRYFT